MLTRQTIPFISWSGVFWNNSLWHSHLFMRQYSAFLIKSIHYSDTAALQKGSLPPTHPHIWQRRDSNPENSGGYEQNIHYQSWKRPQKSRKVHKSLILQMGKLSTRIRKRQIRFGQWWDEGQQDLLTQKFVIFPWIVAFLSITQGNSFWRALRTIKIISSTPQPHVGTHKVQSSFVDLVSFGK